MQALGAYLPLAAVALIVVLIVRSRFARSGPRFTLPRFAPKPRPKKPAGTLLRFEPGKMDDELRALLRKRR
jgi:hypothetical protein